MIVIIIICMFISSKSSSLLMLDIIIIITTRWVLWPGGLVVVKLRFLESTLPLLNRF